MQATNFRPFFQRGPFTKDFKCIVYFFKDTFCFRPFLKDLFGKACRPFFKDFHFLLPLLLLLLPDTLLALLANCCSSFTSSLAALITVATSPNSFFKPLLVCVFFRSTSLRAFNCFSSFNCCWEGISFSLCAQLRLSFFQKLPPNCFGWW